MINKMYDISTFVNTVTESTITSNLINRVKQRRKELKISQKKLATMSGVSFASIRRFEATGNIALKSLIRIAHAMKCLEDFEHLFENPIITNLKDYNP